MAGALRSKRTAKEADSTDSRKSATNTGSMYFHIADAALIPRIFGDWAVRVLQQQNRVVC